MDFAVYQTLGKQARLEFNSSWWRLTPAVLSARARLQKCVCVCVYVCVFLTGRMGAPAACLCDLVKVLLFYFGGTASFSLFLPVTPSLFSSGAAR